MTIPETTSPSITELAGPSPAYTPARRLAGKVCLVVGATSGIGRATALRMAEEGAAAVFVSGRRQALGQELAGALCRTGTESLFITADVTCEADLASLVEQTMTRFGRVDAVFNNAGFQEYRAARADQPDEIYSQVFDTNLRAVFHAMRHEIPALIASGGGAIVNNTSVSGIRNPNPGLSLYGASKAAAIALTRAGQGVTGEVLRLPHRPRRASYQQTTSPSARSAPSSCSARSTAASDPTGDHHPCRLPLGHRHRPPARTARSQRRTRPHRRSLRHRRITPSSANQVSSYTERSCVLIVHDRIALRGIGLKEKAWTFIDRTDMGSSAERVSRRDLWGSAPCAVTSAPTRFMPSSPAGHDRHPFYCSHVRPMLTVSIGQWTSLAWAA